MSFVIRSAEEKDLNDLLGLASQFALLNLPPDEDILFEKIQRSEKSFSGQNSEKKDCEYLFVLEDVERKKVIGSSLILAKHGTPDCPHFFYEIRKEDRFSRDLGIGFIHQILRLGSTTDGPTEIGGLLIDKTYRSRPEKLGKQISLMRFVYIGMHPGKFEKKLLCEFAPPLTRDGRSEFWEALGRRFTGLNYQEADVLSQKHKEFIQTLFPRGDIYLSILDSSARQVLGQVSEQTRPAQHLLEGLGFRYLQEVDPFDGGPHYGVEADQNPLIKNLKKATVSLREGTFAKHALLGFVVDGKFKGTLTAYDQFDMNISLPKSTRDLLGLNVGDEVFFSDINYEKVAKGTK